MSKNLTDKPTQLLAQISLYDFWIKGFQPLLPLLADESQVGISQLKSVLPNFLKIIVLKISTKLLQDAQISHQNVVGQANNEVFSALSAYMPIAHELTQQGINFMSLQLLSHQRQSLFEQYFDDETQRMILAGVLLEKTKLPLHKLLMIWQTVTILALANLANIIELLQKTVTKEQVQHWLIMQPTIFLSPADIGLMQAVNYQPTVSLVEMQKQQRHWQKLTNSLELLPYQRSIVQQMQAYQQANFFSIVPVSQRANHTITPRITSSDTKIAPIPNRHDLKKDNIKKDNIFAKPMPPQSSRWLDKLQKHWIATATVLSVAVFGSVGAFVTVNHKAVDVQPNTKTIPQKPVYQDVAIVKVASVATIADTQKKDALESTKHEKNIGKDKATLAKLAGNKDSQKLDKQKSYKSDEHNNATKNDSKKADAKSNNKASKDDNKAVDKTQSPNKKIIDKKTTDKKTTDKQTTYKKLADKKSTIKDSTINTKSSKKADNATTSQTHSDKKAAKKPQNKASDK